MTTAHVPKATLYWFGGSVWAAPAVLTKIEKGYTAEELEERIVDLGKGENFSPAFLRINPQGTVPVLVVPWAHTVEEGIQTKYKAITGSQAVCDFLDQATLRSSAHSAPALSPATIARAAAQKDLIELVHKEDVDPNLLLLSFRDENEAKTKFGGLVGGFLKGRQEALERFVKEVGDSDARLKEFYQKKIQENGGLIAMYEGKADATEWQKAAKERWAAVAKTFAALEDKFEPNASYLVGDQVSLADLHVGAWLARVLAVSGASSVSDVPAALSAIESQLPAGKKIGPKVAKWAEELFARESFKTVYADGFH
ncbi:hypothetical protein JCM8097_008012 [Rhodosporidiobolus ruineniae]